LIEATGKTAHLSHPRGEMVNQRLLTHCWRDEADNAKACGCSTEEQIHAKGEICAEKRYDAKIMLIN
jgi:hypothetical protein